MALRVENRLPIFWIIAGPNGSGKSSLYSAPDAKISIYDNSGTMLRRVGLKKDGIVKIEPTAPSALQAALGTARP